MNAAEPGAQQKQTKRPLSTGKRILIVLVMHALILGGLILFFQLIGDCPIKKLTGFSCPGCGLTRAHLAALRLDFREAFACHPLFPLAIPTLLYMAHARLLARWVPKKAELLLLIAVGVVFFSVFVYRMWISPSPMLSRDFTSSLLYQLFSKTQASV